MTGADLGRKGKLIVIVGFMGSGKTTVARELARLLKCPAIDLDELICDREHRTAGEIIEQSGEEEFRHVETETLRHALQHNSSNAALHIIALGGGTWTLRRNRDLINEQNVLTIWLDAPFELCWKRIQTSGVKRPLARDEVQARMLYAHRRPQYALVELQLQVTEQSPAEICRDLIETGALLEADDRKQD